MQGPNACSTTALVKALVLNLTLALFMEGGTYSFAFSGLFASDGGWIDSWKQDSFAYPHDYQISDEASPAGLDLFSPSGPMHGVDGGRTEYERFPPPTLPGHEVYPLALIDDPANAGLADVNTAYNLHNYDTMLDSKVSSNFIEISSKKRAAGSSRRARRPAGMRKVHERPFSCDICGKRYSQRQGVSRHSHAMHRNPHPCLCCDFKWNRPYQYRIHLEQLHPDVDPDNVLGKSAGSRRRSAIIGRDSPPHFPHPVADPEQRSHVEPQQRPMPPLPAAAKVTSRKCEDTRVLGLYDATDTPAFSSTEESSQSVNNRNISIQRGELWLPSTPSGGSSLGDRPSNL